MLNRSLAAIWLVHVISTACAAAGPVRAVRPDDATGTSAAVVVDTAANLFYTTQLLPVGADQKVIAPDGAEEQAVAVLNRLESTLKGAASRGSINSSRSMFTWREPMHWARFKKPFAPDAGRGTTSGQLCCRGSASSRGVGRARCDRGDVLIW